MPKTAWGIISRQISYTMDGLDGLELPPRGSRTSIGSDSQAEDVNTNTNSATNKAAREIKKRNRIPVSCNECRRRKLRSSTTFQGERD